MAKFVRCISVNTIGEGISPKDAYRMYRENGGKSAPQDCSYERVEEISIEIQWVELVSDADIKCGDQDE